MDKTDAELVALNFSGDEEAFKVIVERHLKSVYNLAYRLTGSSEEAEDIAQEVFLRAWKNLKKYQPEKNFKTWLLTIAKNASIDYLRKKRAVPFSDFEDDEGENPLTESLADPLPYPIELVETAQNREMIEKAVSKLSPNYQAVLFLKYQEELTFEEIGRILEKPLDTVKSQHLRALVKLRKMLRDVI
jgi:RNA polymerase sigma-70 factor (ECF subfamily)